MSENKKKIRNLSLFALTWPIFIEALLHMLMGNADTLMLSQYSDDSVAAVGVSNEVMRFIVVMFGFIATGTSVLIAQQLGADNAKKAKEVAVVALAANLISGLVLSLFLIFGSSMIFNLMGLDESLLGEASLYLAIVGGFAFVQALLMTCGAILRSHRFTRDVMYVTVGMNILNIIGNYLVIFGPFGLPVYGVTGVAIVTAGCRFLGLIVIFSVLLKRINGSLPFAYLFQGIPRIELRNLLKIGIPTAGEHFSFNTMQLLITSFIATIGTEALTTKVYTQNLMMLVLLCALAIGQGTQIIIGYHVGAKNLNAAYKRCISSLKIAVCLSTSVAIMFYLLSKPLLGIFTDNVEIITMGSTLLLLAIIIEPGRTFNVICINSLRAAGDAKFPVYIGIFSMWLICVPIAYLLGIHFGLGLIGVWIAFAVDEWFRGIFMLRRWKQGKWREMSFVTETKEKQGDGSPAS
ncbi:MATE family efflux transporter [Salipaludibacillus sp. HK11]|uniref:MATE family efflux transporter n=1 Tax=Salipaludibacillus sp. HK11 TaxID=3394320 RepID=UPI0039FD2AF7